MRTMEIAIVEDDDISADNTISLLEKYEQEHDVHFHTRRFVDGLDILDQYKGEYDIIFLDIMMKHMDGMKTAQKIRTVDDQTVLIFLTSSVDYAVQGYKVEALGYIVKPISYFEFSTHLDRALAKIEHAVRKYITISVETGIQKFEISDIYYIESIGHQLVYHTKQGIFSVRETIGDAEEKLCDYDFFRSNKGYLVNLQWVSSVKDGTCEVKGDVLTVSRRRYKQFAEALLAYMSRKV